MKKWLMPFAQYCAPPLNEVIRCFRMDCFLNEPQGNAGNGPLNKVDVVQAFNQHGPAGGYNSP